MSTTTTPAYVTTAHRQVLSLIDAAGGWEQVVRDSEGIGVSGEAYLKEAASLREQAARVEGDGASLMIRQARYAVGASKFGDPANRATVPAMMEHLAVSKAKAERFVLLGLATHVDLSASDVRALWTDIATVRNLGGREEATVPALTSRNPVKAMADLRASLEALKVEREAEETEGETEGTHDAPAEKTPEEKAAAILRSIGGMAPTLAGVIGETDPETALTLAVSWAQVISTVNDAIRARGITRDHIRDALKAQAEAAQAEAEAATEQAATA